MIKKVFNKIPALTLVNILLTIVNIFLVYKANIISDSALKANQASIGFQVDTRSEEYVSKTYDEIYEDQEAFSVLETLKANNKVNDRGKLLSVVDVLEQTGSQFCQGTAKRRHISIYLTKTLNVVCNHDEVFENFKNQKNGLAILCTEFSSNSKFATTLNKDNINTCEFVDSWVFPKTQNRYKFEYTQ